MTNTQPDWWQERFGTVSAQFTALQAARTPEPKPVSCPKGTRLAPVIALNGVRVERAAKAIKAMMERTA